jgi:hypothetical protein
MVEDKYERVRECGTYLITCLFGNISHRSHQFLIMFLITESGNDEKHDEILMRMMRDVPSNYRFLVSQPLIKYCSIPIWCLLSPSVVI